MENNILARVILEMLGAPKDYIEQTMKNYVGKLKKQGVKIEKEHYEEAIEQGRLFSTFAELEVRFKDLPELISFCFDALPSSIEILEPESLQLNSNDLSGFLNDLQAKLHKTDMIVKTLTAQKELLDSNAMTVFRNFIVSLLKNGPMSLEDLSNPIGVKPEELKPFLDKLIEKEKVKLESGLYSLK